ncbi:MAG: RNA polymerase sigma factor [Candidatus Wolfebacteria bacterium]|nr:RNA polymerase sigma factor [Candidatus Wolfebacteria bacterium]
MSFDLDDEKEVIAAAKKGDLRAFEQLLFLYEKRIYAHIYGFVNQKYDAEDLTQETFVKLYKNIGNIDTEKSFKGWLYKIATNTVYDWLRRKKSAPMILELNEEIAELEELETIEDNNPYDRAEKKKLVDDALREVKPAHKKILHLFYREDLGYKEIAKALNIPINTVKTNLRRAKAALKKILEKHE